MRTKLEKLTIRGYKSFSWDHPQEIELGDINILIGANGSGKSNFVSFFKMLNVMTTGALQEHVGGQGGANSLLHYGAKNTPALEGNFVFRDKDNDKDNTYSFRLADASPDTLIFTEEKATYRVPPHATKSIDLGVGHKESKLLSDETQQTASLQVTKAILRKCKVYQFHDTTNNAYVRKTTLTDNTRFLYADGGNLAAYLLGMRSVEKYLPYYNRTVKIINNIFPPFGDFVLEPAPFNPHTTMLNWQEKRNGNDYIFGPHQISDGTLRFMALATLLLQPPELLPNLLIIDEPELGLHPAAIGALAGMVQIASENCQVIMATQSARLLDEFSPDEIIIV